MSADKKSLGEEEINKLIARYAIPAIISMLVSSCYNLMDQIFIGNGVGMLGNAATNIAFPISTVCLATALLFGVGGAANFNLRSGEGRKEEAKKYAGSAFLLLVLFGIGIMVIVLVFLKPLVVVFGATTEVLPYAMDYTGITAFGIPFLILTTGGNHLIRADGSPTFSILCMIIGAVINSNFAHRF